MHSDLDIRLTSTGERSSWAEWGAGAALFAGAAVVVVWQTSHLAVLWDLSYVLENAHRIALGEIPYRDFPFPYPPLTFLIQAALIKLTGRVFWHTIVYCVVINGLATIVTWRILRNLLRETVARYRWLAFGLSLPLIPLGVYSIFPHPFYDPDCTFAILISILCLQQVERKKNSITLALFAGATLVIPLFIKQNTGLAFLLSTIALIVVLASCKRFRNGPARRYLAVLAGATVTFATAVVLIHFTAGLKNYWHWTIQFAAERRTPARAEMLGIYFQRPVALWLVLIAIGLVLVWFSRNRSRLVMRLAAALVSIPFLWPVIYLLRDSDSSERAERLVNLWPIVLIVSLIVAAIRIKSRRDVSLILPFILIATIQGAFLSQQLWGSTYAIWPFLIILIAMSLSTLSPLRLDARLGPQSKRRTSPPTKRFEDRSSWWFVAITVAIVLSLLVSGCFYLRSHERLSYANLDDGELKRSTLPQLRGLATRGDWLPNFDALVQHTNQKIPRDEGILLLPGEDLFYFTTGRKPQFPVLLFDRTVNPYSPEQIVQLCRDRNIQWLIVKQDLQDEDDAVDQEKDKITDALEQDFEQVESVGNYDIYHRGKSDEDDEDDRDDSN